jgi:hypothetical protein
MKLSDFIADLELLRAKHGDDVEVKAHDIERGYVPADAYLVAWRTPLGVITRKEVHIEPANQ